MHAARFVPLQAWYTYAQLGALWHCSPRSVARWLRELRRRDPDRVFVTYKIRHGLRRELLIGQLTAQTSKIATSCHLRFSGHCTRPFRSRCTTLPRDTPDRAPERPAGRPKVLDLSGPEGHSGARRRPWHSDWSTLARRQPSPARATLPRPPPECEATRLAATRTTARARSGGVVGLDSSPGAGGPGTRSSAASFAVQ
jgi:hypothetical protein